MSEPKPTPDYRTQLVFSLLAAVIVTLLSIVLVTAKIGPGLDSEELHDLGIDDRQEQLEERREERQEELEEQGEG